MVSVPIAHRRFRMAAEQHTSRDRGNSRPEVQFSVERFEALAHELGSRVVWVAEKSRTRNPEPSSQSTAQDQAAPIPRTANMVRRALSRRSVTCVATVSQDG